MKELSPTPAEMDQLISFLPILYAEGFTPIKGWKGGNRDQEGAVSAPWPDYEESVRLFFDLASHECWCDHDYQPEEADRMLEDHQQVRNASILQIKSMLTYCVRGERFCEGHWAAMLERGHIRRILERLAQIRQARVE